MKKSIIFLGYLTLFLLALSMLFPFLVMIYLSFVPNQCIFASSGEIQLTTKNYLDVFYQTNFPKYFFNSFVTATLSTIGQVIISAFAGYAFARLQFKFKNVLFLIILVTMMIPPQVNIIPLFFLMRELHLVNTYPALILPALFGGFGIFMMRQFYLALPKDLENSAIIDGCNIFQIFTKIALPLSKPALVTLSIFTFVINWNSFMWPLIITNTDSMRTLPVALTAFKGAFRELTLWGDLFACSVLCCLPVILIFILGKKYFINNLLSGAIKE